MTAVRRGQVRADWKVPEAAPSGDEIGVFLVFMLREVYTNRGKFLVGFMISTKTTEQINNNNKKGKLLTWEKQNIVC